MQKIIVTFKINQQQIIIFGIDKLKPGEEKTQFYEVVVNDLENEINQKDIQNNIVTKIEDQEYSKNVLNNKIIKAKIELDFKFYINRDKKDSFVYFLYVKNLTNETMNNIEVTSTDFQKEMNVLFAKYFVEEMTDFGSISNGRLEGTIDQLAPGETKTITMDMWAENFDENVNEVPLSMAIDVKIDDDIYRTWEARRNAYPEYVTAKISLDKEGEEVKYDEDLTYTIHIKNESKIKTYVNIEDYLPEEIEGNLITYDKYIIEEKEGNSIHGNTEYDIEAEANLPYTLEHIEKDASIDYENEGHLNENVVIPAGKTLTITITAKAGSVLETTEVSNYVKVSGGDIETVTSNIVKFTLLSNYQNPIDPDNPDNPDPDNPDPDNPDPDNPDPDNQKTYSIFGVVWQDDNKDGKRESNEPTMSNVIVKLYNASNNSIVAKEDGTQQKVLTDNQGRYEFKDVKQGKYLVLFEYDTSNYNITQYQKEGVEENLNSDVIEKEVSIDNVIKKVGLTDTLEIANSNISNIDMGLIQNAIFDLKLDKYISKVIVENSSGKRQYSYDNSQLAKIEIKSKYLKETKITIEYNIKITNEGDVVAYASNIIDYLPKELEFNSVDNKGWVKQEDYLSNSSLSKELIEPGQTKELSLILTKNMTENATGTIVNIAEIGESKNLDNLTDVDSVANNKNRSEDDYSEAQLIISIDTGVITYTVIGIITLAILIFIFLYFKGKIFKNKKFKIVTKIFILSLFLTSILVSNVQALSIRWEGAYDNDPNAYYIGDDGNIYACGHTGWHQCSAENVHAYNNPPSQSEVTVTGEKEVSKKNIKLKKNSNSVVVKPSGTNNIIGPYKVQSNCTESSISGISIVYSKNGKKETATGTKNMVDSNGNTIKNFNMTQNKDFQFYLKFSNDVTRIESISVTVSVKNVKVTEKTTRYRATYYCTWVAPTYQHSFGSNISTDTTQPMYRYMTSTSTSNSNGSDSVSFGAYDISGSLLIKKTGTKSGENLSDVTFEITGPNNYSSTQKTNSNGEIRIDNLRVGKYTVVEKSIGLNGIGEKNYGYVVEGTPTQEGNVIAGGLKEFKFSNDYKLGSISIDKTDVDTHAKMKDIEFTLQMTSGLKNGKYVNRDSNGRATYHDTVQTLKTDSSGQIIIKDAFIGDYKLIETKNPYEAYEELPVGGKVMTGTIKVNTTENVSVTNKRKYVDLSGYAWEDMLRKEGKNEYLNGLYNADNADNADKKLENITVQLKDRDNNIIRTKITDSSGNYKFEKVEIDKLKDYYIEFIYNGMSYNTVDVQGLSLSNSTKAIEGSNRTQFNSEYKEITKGKSNSYKLNYETSDYKSKLLYGNKQNYKYGYNGQENPISGVDQQYLISATTKNAYLSAGGGNSGYLTDIMSAYEIRQNAITEVKNINLGVTKRHQPDLSVVKDIESVKVQINDTEHIYKYADRFNNKDIYGDGYTLEPRVKFGEKYGNMSYTRALYASDIKYKEQNEDKQLKVYVTYKIGVRNSSDRLISIVNEMADYYDDKYIVTAVGKEINPDGTIKGNSIQYRSEQSGTSGYQKIKITTDLQINPQTEGNIYVRLQVMPQQIVNILGDSNDEVKLDNITEIVSYGTKDKNGAIYAGIDVDSQPDSIQIGNIKTYEDDTDKAPGLKLVLQEERTTAGKVFLDSTGDLKQNDIRQGSGAYEEGEKGIPDVEVKLVDSVTNQTVKVYDEDLKQWKDGITKTDNDGNYEISGFIPGYYKILYIWGDKTYKVQDYKGTIVDKNSYNSKGNGQNQNEEWYKDDFKKATNGIEWNTRTNKEIRVSDATDNYATREKIDGQTKIMINKNKENINKYDDTQIQIDDSGTMQDLITKMDSSTPIFKVNLEYSTKETDHKEEYELDANNQIVMNGIYAKKKDEFKYNIQSIDFGIVERARQILALDKKVQEAKIVLTDGSILVNLKIKEDGTIEDSTKYVAYIPKSQGANGQVKFEIDQEIIQGARLEIKYNLIATNIGEKEYLNKEYYLYGKGHGDTTDSDLATLNPKMIIDYLDDKIATDMSENDKWQVIQENSKRNELINKGLLSDTLQSTINSISKVVVSDNIAKNLKPGEKSTEIYLTGYKLLASTNDDTALENDAEIIKIEKTGGSTIQTTPGNYIPTDISTSEVDNGKAETIIIIPPTGLSTDYIMYTVLALTSLGILISGIILIKKYVLKY